jgi:type VI secretion system protein ImpE
MVRMSPIELFHEARLTEALAAHRAAMAARPDDVSERLVLCDLLGFTGDREAVRRELDALRIVPAEVREYATEWRALLAADDARHRGDPPTFLIDPPRHVLTRLRGLDCLWNNREDDALDLLDEADDTAPPADGHVDGRPFERWRDADDVLGPVIELFHDGRHAWLAVDQVRKLRLDDDANELRDLLYRPATVWLTDGSEWGVFIPGLYVDTAGHPEDGIRTGAGVDWIERCGVMRGLGSRTFLFGEEELTLSEFRQVEVRG